MRKYLLILLSVVILSGLTLAAAFGHDGGYWITAVGTLVATAYGVLDARLAYESDAALARAREKAETAKENYTQLTLAYARRMDALERQLNELQTARAFR
jgi:predicted outer membrane lipoprotein